MPPIDLSNICKSEGGASPAEVAQLLLGTITQSASQVATASLINALGNLKDLWGGVTSAATSTVGSAGGQIKSMFVQ